MRRVPPLAWLALALAALTIAGNYYAYDAVAPAADLLRTQRGFSQSQLGFLNAIASLPNIVLSLFCGLIIDRVGAAKAAFGFALVCFVGAVMTAIGQPFALMAAGRLIFGVGEETVLIALLAGLAQWFSAGGAALSMSLLFSLARVGSYMADISPRWAGPLYHSWRPPLVLAAALTGISMVTGLLFWLIDSRRAPGEAAASERFELKGVLRFDRSFWYILGLNVLYASVFFPFRSTFAIEFFQDAKHQTLAMAGLANSWVFFAAIFATPVFGAIADRFGHRCAMLSFGAGLVPLTFLLLDATDASLWVSTALMGISFSVVPAVIWPTTAMLVEERRLGTAFGVINVLQSLGMFLCNWIAGGLNDAYRAGPAHPEGYGPMLVMFGALSLVGFLCTLALWRRESGPNGHGLGRPPSASSAAA
ncbi:MFS transporter [Phenylobacterium montanum]|uniref:Lysosomal dipeptide transporter MFSD1 n=1 Tax=Phenylobacterium montanum TaxID=2823693 RepID=A0A975FWD4_9CAUL|nr:MFS transporter [Caulobacter sp. S6]QUD86698.1 MFS transporter [Caulobacter sp. S6]